MFSFSYSILELKLPTDLLRINQRSAKVLLQLVLLLYYISTNSSTESKAYYSCVSLNYFIDILGLSLYTNFYTFIILIAVNMSQPLAIHSYCPSYCFPYLIKLLHYSIYTYLIPITFPNLDLSIAILPSLFAPLYFNPLSLSCILNSKSLCLS